MGLFQFTSRLRAFTYVLFGTVCRSDISIFRAKYIVCITRGGNIYYFLDLRRNSFEQRFKIGLIYFIYFVNEYKKLFLIKKII
jgi:hypothetical protein